MVTTAQMGAVILVMSDDTLRQARSEIDRVLLFRSPGAKMRIEHAVLRLLGGVFRGFFHTLDCTCGRCSDRIPDELDLFVVRATYGVRGSTQIHNLLFSSFSRDMGRNR